MIALANLGLAEFHMGQLNPRRTHMVKTLCADGLKLSAKVIDQLRADPCEGIREFIGMPNNIYKESEHYRALSGVVSAVKALHKKFIIKS